MLQLLHEIDVEYAPTTIKKWVSPRTGLQVVHISKDSPMVYGHFALGTKITNDTGCPHTLEHLIFTGSKKYPYKGFLDLLAGMNLSSTNASTYTNKTVYYLESAGWQGFHTVLPVYLDHIINPTLTEDACITEVYHIDGEGKDKGVVYSEMETDECSSDSELVARKLFFSKESGYASETGGLPKHLRELQHSQIVDYHHDVYKSDNLCVIVIGTIDEDQFLQTMSQFDDELPDKGPDTTKPFVNEPDPIILKDQVVKKVEFADTDESSGSVDFSVVGPDILDSVETLAFRVLATYLTGRTIALLEQKLVESDDPYASDTGWYSSAFSRTYATLYADGVDTDKLLECNKLIPQLLKEHATEENFNFDLLVSVLEQEKDLYLQNSENNANFFANAVMNDFLYAKDLESRHLKDLATLKNFNELAQWTKSDWVKFMKQYYVDCPHTAIYSVPSPELVEKKNREKETRVAERREKLGEEGLLKLKERVEKAEKANDPDIPDGLFEQFEKPDITKVNFINSKPVKLSDRELNKDSSLYKHIFADAPVNFPLEMYFDNYQSNFLTVELLFSSENLSEENHAYWTIFHSLFSNPMVLDDGTKLSYETVVQKLDSFFLSYDISFGRRHDFEEVIDMFFRFRKTNYAEAINWIGNCMHNIVNDRKRVKSSIEKVVRSLAEVKRSGGNVLSCVSNTVLMSKKSMTKSFNRLEYEDFLRDILVKVDTDEGYASILKNLEEMRKALFGDPKNMRVLVFGDIEHLDHPVSAWQPFVDKFAHKNNKTLAHSTDFITPRSLKYKSTEGLSLGKHAYCVGTPGSESAYLYSVAKCPAADYNHKDLPAIIFMSSYLDITEGLLWKAIRGGGFGYGANLQTSFEVGELICDIYQSTDVVGAFTVSKKIINDLASGKLEFEQKMIESTLSWIVGLAASSEATQYTSCSERYNNDELRKRGPDFNAKLFQQLKNVTIDDMKRVTKKYFVPLFEPESSHVFVVFNPDKEKEITSFFEKEGYKVSYRLIEDSSDSESESGSGSDSDSDSDSEPEA